MNYLIFLFLFIFSTSNTQETYTVGNTEYISGEYYQTGHPKVKRSESNKKAFLRSKGYTVQPKDYNIDHIIPLSEDGRA